MRPQENDSSENGPDNNQTVISAGSSEDGFDDTREARYGAGRSIETTNPQHDASSARCSNPAPVPALIGRYRVQRRLGQGAFGSVFQAMDEQLHRGVAIKVPNPEVLAKGTSVQSYLQEAQALARLEHPAIIPIYDVGSTSEFPCFVVSRLIEGTDLKTRMDQGPVPLEQAAAIVIRIAEALHHAHSQGLVHRDVKPANILIDRQGKAWLADFGIALQDEDLGAGPEYVGTPAYMSPEQITGSSHRLDGRSDIFSLGVVLYELLSGKRPFRSKSQVELTHQISSMEARPLRQINDSIPEAVDQVCRKALAKNVTDRYSTAKDFAEDLATALQIKPVVAQPNTPAAAQKPFQWTASFRAMGCSVTLAMSVLMAVTGSIWLFDSMGSSATDVEMASLDSDSQSTSTPTEADQPTTSPASVSSKLQNTLIRRFEILVSREQGAFRPVAELSPIQNGDSVRFSIQLTEPAWVRLMWIDANGQPAELYPDDPEVGHRGDGPVTTLESPIQLDRGWPVEGNAGMETALLLVSKERLPTVDMKEFHTGQPSDSAARSVVHFQATRSEPATVTATQAVSNGATRSLGHKSQPANDAVMQLLERVRQHADYAEAITIPHQMPQ